MPRRNPRTTGTDTFNIKMASSAQQTGATSYFFDSGLSNSAKSLSLNMGSRRAAAPL